MFFFCIFLYISIFFFTGNGMLMVKITTLENDGRRKYPAGDNMCSLLKTLQLASSHYFHNYP